VVSGTPPFQELFDANVQTNGSQARLVPARSPDGNAELDQANYKCSGVWSRLGPYGNETAPNRAWRTNATVVSNHSYNRGGLFPSYSVGVHGPADNFAPPVSFWASPAGLKAGGGSLYSVPAGVVTAPAAPCNASLLAPEAGGFVFMMQTHSWGSWVFEINSSSTNSSGFSHLSFGEGGQQEARGNGGAGGGSFYISHRRELLDAPGEWWHDARDNVLYLATVADAAPPPAKGLVAPVVEELVIVGGTQDAPATDIRLSSLVFRHAAPTFMRRYTVPSGGDYSVFKGGAVTFNGTRNCSVDHSLERLACFAVPPYRARVG
jgi:hypothetical protein